MFQLFHEISFFCNENNSLNNEFCMILNVTLYLKVMKRCILYLKLDREVVYGTLNIMMQSLKP